MMNSNKFEFLIDNLPDLNSSLHRSNEHVCQQFQFCENYSDQRVTKYVQMDEMMWHPT